MRFWKFVAPVCAIGVLAGCSASSDSPSTPPADQPVASNDSAPKTAPPSDTKVAAPKTAGPGGENPQTPRSARPPQPGSPDPSKTTPALSGPKIPDNVPEGEMNPGADREAVYFNACRSLVDHLPKTAGQKDSWSFPDKSANAQVISNGQNRYTVHIDASLGKTKHKWVIVLVKDDHGTFQTESAHEG